MRIAELKASLNLLNEKVSEFELRLHTISGNLWKTAAVPDVDEIHLVSLVSQCDKSIEETEASLTLIKDDMRLNQKELERVQERLKDKKEEIDKEYPQGAQYIELNDCKEAKEKYRKERNRLKQESHAKRNEINQLTRSINDIQNTRRLLNSLSLSTKVQIPSTLTDEDKVSIVTNPMEYYTLWTHENNKATNEYRAYQDSLGKRINQMKDKIESFTNIPLNYQRELIHFLSVIRDMSFEEAVICLENYLEWAKHNLQDELEQKGKAEKAIDLYVERQSIRELEILNALQDLVRKMTIVNWKGERVRLVKFNKNYPFPNNLEDIRPLVKEFCLNEIDYYVRKGKDRINDLTVQDVAKTVNISNLTLKVLGDFPKLLIHIPSLEGGLLRGEEKHLTYKEWETINHGSNSSPTKSGGQTLLAHLIVLAMIMRQRVDENSSLFLVSDNPFGTMSAKELIEATFSLLDLLNIQWVVVAPPIANVHITSKFPTINNLGLQLVEGRQVLTQKLVKNYRKYMDNISVLDNPDQQSEIS
jgi:C1A family cysteine protease